MTKYLIETPDFSIKCEDNICFVDLSAASCKNAVSLEMASCMKEVILVTNKKTSITRLESFLAEQNAVIVVLRSLVANIFSSGGHLRDLITGEDSTKTDYGNSVREFCKLLSSMSTPSVAILAGNAYGGGAELALAPDFRWSVGNEVEFHFVQAGLGVPGGWGGMRRLGALCPGLNSKRVSSMFLAQDVLNLQDLTRLSLIDKVFLNEKTCYLELFKWRDNLLACNVQLKNDFFARNKVAIEKQEEFDKSFFQKYFLCADHKKNILNFLMNKRKK